MCSHYLFWSEVLRDCIRTTRTLPQPVSRTSSLRSTSSPILRSSAVTQVVTRSFRRRDVAGQNLDPDVCERVLIRRLSIVAQNCALPFLALLWFKVMIRLVLVK